MHISSYGVRGMRGMELVKVVDNKLIIHEKAKKLVKEEYVAQTECLIEALVEEFERNNLQYTIQTEGFEVILQAKPKQDMYDVDITVEFGKDTYIRIGKYNIIKDEDITIFTFMFTEPVFVKIARNFDISLTTFDGKTKYYATIPRLEEITVKIDLKDQFITVQIN